MHEMRNIAIADPVARASVMLSVTRATVLTYSPGYATLMRPLLRYSTCCWEVTEVGSRKSGHGPISVCLGSANTTSKQLGRLARRCMCDYMKSALWQRPVRDVGV